MVLGIQCELQRQLHNFISLDRLPMTPPVGTLEQCTSSSTPSSGGPAGGPRFSALPSIFGKGVRFAILRGLVTAEIVGVASEDSRRVASILNGAMYLAGLRFTVDGSDTHHFLKPGAVEDDLAVLGGLSGGRVLENGVNVTVSQMTAAVGGRSRRFADIQLRHGALCLSVRYGATPDEARQQLLEAARERAVEEAWARERRLLLAGEEGSRVWSDGEREQLRSTGKVAGYDGYFVLSVEQYLELADSANNIRFMKQSEVGRR